MLGDRPARVWAPIVPSAQHWASPCCHSRHGAVYKVMAPLGVPWSSEKILNNIDGLFSSSVIEM